MPNVITFTEFVKVLLPEGAFWEPIDNASDYTYVIDRSGNYVTDRTGDLVITRDSSERDSGGYQLILEGIGDNVEAMYDNISRLAYIREPEKTDILDDLEREYGILKDDNLTEAERREYLSGVKYARAGTGGLDYLQNALNNAGFAVQVHSNTPAINPISMYVGGLLIVNKSFDEDEDPLGMTYQERWAFTFFIGGNATRADDGRITSITPVVLTTDEQKAMAKIVLKHKPEHSWCVAVVTSNDYFTLSSDTTWQTSTTQGYGDGTGTTGGYWRWE